MAPGLADVCSVLVILASVVVLVSSDTFTSDNNAGSPLVSGYQMGNYTAPGEHRAQLLRAQEGDYGTHKILLQFDGTYFKCPIRVGNTVYQVQLTFSSSMLWIFEERASDFLVDDFPHKYYPPTHNKGVPFHIDYLDGTFVFGHMAKSSNVEFGEIKIPNSMEIGVVNTFTLDGGEREVHSSRTSLDGVLGLGLVTQAFQHVGKQEGEELESPFLINLLFSGALPLAPRFSLHLAGDGTSGELLFLSSSSDKEYCHGALTYVPLVLPLSTSWVVTFDSFEIGDSVLAKNQAIEVNIGSNALWAPKDVINDIIQMTGGDAKWDTKTPTVSIDCNKRDHLPDLVFKFNNVPHKFESHEYFPEFIIPGYTMKERKCTLFMMDSDSLPPAPQGSGEGLNPQQRWSLGVPFFKKFYSVYEKADLFNPFSWRVGFALSKPHHHHGGGD